jgi:WD40 repeat protein
LRPLEGHSDQVGGVAVSADGRRAVSSSVSSSVDNTVKLWEVDSGRELRSLQGMSTRAHIQALTADGRLALLAFDDHTLRVWDLESKAEPRILGRHTSPDGGTNPIRDAAMSADGRLAFSASRDKNVEGVGGGKRARVAQLAV